MERHRIQLSGSYLILGYTGARPAEIVDNEKKMPKDSCWEDLYGSTSKATEVSDDDDQEEKTSEEYPGLLEELLMQETAGRGRPKALCYEDISMMVVRHPSTGKDVITMAIKFIHHKGSDNKPKP
jgi:hypothetical protein